MNTIYRIVWNATLGKWVVASELAKGRKKPSSLKNAMLSLAVVGAMAGVGVPTAFAAGVDMPSCVAGEDPHMTGCVPTSREQLMMPRFADGGGNDFAMESNVAIGRRAVAGSAGADSSATAIGDGAEATAMTSTAIGAGAKATGKNAVALGAGAVAGTWDNAIAIGTAAKANGTGSIALGANAVAGLNAIAMGTDADAKGLNAFSMGVGSRAANYSVALGGFAWADGIAAAAFGTNAVASGYRSTAFGNFASASGENDGAFGYNAKAIYGSGAVAFGAHSVAGSETIKNSRAVAIGAGSVATGMQAVSIGPDASATGTDSVALGAGSIADRDNVISVGHGGMGNGTRQIVNVAKGTADSDAVSVSQLKPVIAALGGGASFNETSGAVLAPEYVVGGESFDNVGDALGNVDGRVTQNAGDITSLTTGIQEGTIGLVQQAAPGAALTVGKDTDGTVVSFADKDGNARTLDSVKDGVADGDAVNMSQLNNTNANVTNLDSRVTQNTNDIRNLMDGAGTTLHYFKANGLNDGTDDAKANGQRSVAIGASAAATGATSTAVGAGASATHEFAVSVGGGSSATARRATAFGTDTKAAGEFSLAIGNAASSGAMAATAAGSGAVASGIGATSLGRLSTAEGDSTLALGANAKATSEFAIAIGGATAASGGANASATYAVALGTNAKASASDAVALGAKSVANRDNTVSVGSNVGGSSFTRQITNLGAGTQGSDAVNVDQLQPVVAALGGGALLDAATGAVTGPTYLVGGNSYSNVGDALGNVDRRVDENKGDINSLDIRVERNRTDIDNMMSGETGLVRQSGADAAITMGAGTGGLLVDVSGTAGDRQVAGVAKATLSNQAVNLEQLNERLEGVSAGDTRYFKANGLNDNTDDAVVTGDNAVAIGAGSIADRDNSVSVGAEGNERTITHVAAGKEDTDAVNLGQLKASGLVGADGTALDAVVYDAGSNRGSVTFGGLGGTLLTNVSAGLIAPGSMDAVNGGQLWNLQDQVSKLGDRVTHIENHGAPGNGGQGPGPGPVEPPPVGEGSGRDPAFAASGTGGAASAAGSDSVAAGTGASASGDKSTAVGAGASASGNNSVAIGAGSVADRADTVSVGSAGNERVVSNVAAGTQRTDAANWGQVQDALATANRYTDDRFDGVNRRIGEVQRQANRGIAASAALLNVTPYMPGKTVLNAGVANYRGESALGVGVSRWNDSGRVNFNAGMSAAAGDTPIFRMGVGVVLGD